MANRRLTDLSLLLLGGAALGLVLAGGFATGSEGAESDGFLSDDRPSPQRDGLRGATPPADAPQLTPVQDPPGIDRRDVTDGALPKGPIEGTWRLIKSQVGGLTDPGVVGTLIATRSHLVVHLQFAEGSEVRVQSSWRRYLIEDGSLVTEVLAGHSNLGGTFAHERPGTLERRLLVLQGTRMRLEQADGSVMEFVRSE